MLRGCANAGDFSAINELDVTLGLCSMSDPFYRGTVLEKSGHVPPDDQQVLRPLEQRRSLAERLLQLRTARPDLSVP